MQRGRGEAGPLDEVPPASSVLTQRGVGGGAGLAATTRTPGANSAAAVAGAARRPASRSRPSGPLIAIATDPAASALSSAPAASRRARPRSGAQVPAAGAAASGSRRGGKAGTHGGGSTSTAAVPGQLQSPRLSNQTWARFVLRATDIQEIQ